MAQTKEQIKSSYPLPVYNYRVTIYNDDDALTMSFAEVSGLSLAYEAVTYKHGLSFAMGNQIIPGMKQPITLSMKRGIAPKNDQLQQWVEEIYERPFSTSPKRDIVIDLCDEVGTPVMRWTVRGALPTKLDAPTFNADSNDVAIEQVDLIAQDVRVDYNL